MVVMEWDHLWKCRSVERKKWARRLKPGASIPHRNTCIKIMRVIHGLMGIKLDKALADTKAELGSPYAGAQDDVWSMKNCREVGVLLLPFFKPSCPPVQYLCIPYLT
mmetsp:Transcript_53131/g.105625  ORF Transcript_53131/g.105625 Transcript_53131/m.105625 type:complete len:107 (+) Transcript_53131:378-698(+)